MVLFYFILFVVVRKHVCTALDVFGTLYIVYKKTMQLKWISSFVNLQFLVLLQIVQINSANREKKMLRGMEIEKGAGT